MSPNRFSVRMTPLSFLGLAIMIMAAESTRTWSSLSWGYSFSINSVTVFRHNLEVAKTLALSIEWTARGGSAERAI